MSMIRELIEAVREDPKRIDELIEALKRTKLDETAKKLLLDLLVNLKDRDKEAYKKLYEVVRGFHSKETIDACEEENIEEYETRVFALTPQLFLAPSHIAP